MQFRKNSGFTIVELLIVIIAIAILATLIITAYNGVQQKAENSKTTAAVQAYKKALLEYATEKGTYPPLSVYQGACLGTGYPSGACWDTAHPSKERPTFNNALSPYLNGSLPSPTIADVGASTGLMGALFYYHSSMTIDGVSSPYVLIYILQGKSTKCSVGPIIQPSPWPNFSSTIPPSGNSGVVGQGVQCWIPMPDPAKL